jgi:hypothetical protein
MIKSTVRIFLILIVFCYQNISQAQELVFAKSIGGDTPDSSSEQGKGIVVDENGNMYVTGTVGGGFSNVVFGEGEANETTITINGSFVAKYNDAHELLWVQQMGASNNGITSYAIAIDVSGNVYVSGTFYQEATFGLGQTNETTLTGTAGEIFLAKYDTSGSLLWAIREGGAGDDNPGGRGLIVDSDGNVYLTGSFNNTVVFGEGESSESTLEGQSSDIFVAKYDTDGVLTWVVKAGGANSEGGKNIDLDADGNIVITGNYFNSAVFGAGLVNETTLNDSNESSFLAKYDNDGVFLWAVEPFSSGTADIGADLKIDNQGDILFTGSFFGTITLGAGTANEMQLTGSGSDEIIVAKYSTEGDFVWAKTAQSSGGDRGVGLAVDTNSNVFITGYYGNEIQFGADERNEATISNAGSSDLFVAKFAPSGEFIWVTSAGGSEWEQGIDIEVDQEGNAYLTGYFRSNITFGKDEANETSFSVSGFNDIFIANFKRSFNAEPEFEIIGETTFQEDFSGTQSITLNQVNTLSDELDQIVSYSISPETSELFDVSFDAASGTMEFTALENAFGEEVFTIIADDGAKENYNYSKEFSIVVEPVNDLPEFTSATTSEATEDILYTYTATATDVDNDELTYTIANESTWLTISDNIVSGTPTEGILAGTFDIIVEDGGVESIVQTVAITVTPVNDAPVITSSLNAEATEDELFSYTATATDIENDELAYSISNQSSWLSMTDNIVSGTPTEGILEGTFDLTLEDENTGSTTQTVTVTVLPVNDAPQITAYSGVVSIPENSLFEIMIADFNVNDVDNDFPEDFELIILEGQNYEVINNQISPVLDFVGSIDVTVMVNDGGLNSEEFTISFEVTKVLALNNAIIQDKFTIYPNPASDLLTVIPSQQSAYEVSIFTIQGDLVHASKVSLHTKLSISLSHLNDGLYIVRIATDGEYGTMKLVKE